MYQSLDFFVFRKNERFFFCVVVSFFCVIVNFFLCAIPLSPSGEGLGFVIKQDDLKRENLNYKGGFRSEPDRNSCHLISHDDTRIWMPEVEQKSEKKRTCSNCISNHLHRFSLNLTDQMTNMITKLANTFSSLTCDCNACVLM